MSSLISKKYFLITFFLLILAEIFSYLSWQNSLINTICFCLIILITLILSWHKLEYGLYILFAELFVGSFGYLFFLPIFGFKISVRMGLFVVVMGVFFMQFILSEVPRIRNESKDPVDINNKKIEFQRLNPEIPRLLTTKKVARDKFFAIAFFGIILLWSFTFGLIRGNSFTNVFFDFNNWLYFLIILPLLSLTNADEAQTDADQQKNIFFKNILSVMSATVLFIGLKTLVLFYLFTHGFADIGSDIYRFIRDTRIGEITALGGGLYRIFIQSQIYALILFLVVFVCHPQERRNPEKKLHITHYTLLVISLVTILLSLSRSFGLGLIFSLFFYLFISLIFDKNLVAFFLRIAKIILLFIVSLVLIFGVLRLPPKRSYDFSVLINKRGISINEPASSSRMNQLKPLILAIVKHPVIGSGFGTAITYKSNDPRAIQESAGGSGLIKTYAFEWGYLDIMLKLGFVGLVVYLYLIYLIMKRLLNFQFPISNFQTNCKLQIQNQKLINHYSLFIIHYSLFFALLALLIVNIFSPYLNHPLGIGFIILNFILCQTKK